MRIHEFLTERIHEDIVFVMDASKFKHGGASQWVW